jgi:hypothetical protein
MHLLPILLNYGQPLCAACCCVLLLQRVVYRGEEMPASRFEVLAGKPDAKKWKTSLYFVGPDGRPAEVSGGAGGGQGRRCSAAVVANAQYLEQHRQTTRNFPCRGAGCQHYATPPFLPGPARPCFFPFLLLLQTMQEWLATRQLDRKALDALSRNVAQIQAWHLYTQSQGGAARGGDRDINT